MADALAFVAVVAAGVDMFRRVHRDKVDSWFFQLDAFAIGAAGGAAVSTGLAEGVFRAIAYGAFLAVAFTGLAWVLEALHPPRGDG
jgi:hypothetical protein